MSTDRMRRKGEDTETEEDWIVRPEDCVVPEPTVFPRRRLQEEKEGQKHSRERPQQQRKFPGNVSEDDEASGGSTIVSFDFPFPSGPLSKWLFPLLGEDEDDPLGPPPFLAPPTVEPPTPGDARQRPVVKKSSQFYQKSRVVHGQCTYWTMNSNIVSLNPF